MVLSRLVHSTIVGKWVSELNIRSNSGVTLPKNILSLELSHRCRWSPQQWRKTTYLLRTISLSLSWSDKNKQYLFHHFSNSWISFSKTICTNLGSVKPSAQTELGLFNKQQRRCDLEHWCSNNFEENSGRSNMVWCLPKVQSRGQWPILDPLNTSAESIGLDSENARKKRRRKRRRRRILGFCDLKYLSKLPISLVKQTSCQGTLNLYMRLSGQDLKIENEPHFEGVHNQTYSMCP